MTPEDLDAIRARDAENRLLRLGPEADPDLGDFIGAAVLDRRALLAEVDRLTLVAMDEGPYLDGQRHERARALPVIEAARALLRRSGSVLMTDAEQEDWAALRAALAEYDR